MNLGYSSVNRVWLEATVREPLATHTPHTRACEHLPEVSDPTLFHECVPANKILTGEIQMTSHPQIQISNSRYCVLASASHDHDLRDLEVDVHLVRVDAVRVGEDGRHRGVDAGLRRLLGNTISDRAQA